MQTIWKLFALVILTTILTVNTVASVEQGGAGALSQALGKPNEMEPNKRQARQLFGGGEIWACGILCPDDESGAWIPYRAPRPTKGKFIPIHG